MSLDRQEAILTIIPLATTHLEAPYISGEVIDMIGDMREQGRGVLVFYSRRGNARAWVCSDCGHYEQCPHCDIAMAYHTTPTKRLVCHQCNHASPFPVICPSCTGSRISPVGVGIQQIEESLTRVLGDTYRILRIDGDNQTKSIELYESIGEYDIILSTHIGSTIVHPHIGAVVWLSFELNLSIPSYRIEEEIFDEITYYKRQGLPIYIQTYTPDHPLLRMIVEGNTRSYVQSALEERRSFHYPPYTEMVTIRIHADKKVQVSDMMRRMLNKITQLDHSAITISHDHDIWDKAGGEWQQKIILKGDNIASLIGELEVEIVRNRGVNLEWN